MNWVCPCPSSKVLLWYRASRPQPLPILVKFFLYFATDLESTIFNTNAMTHTEQAILDIPQQFAFKARIENESQLVPKNKYLLVGMGGSHLAADILKSFGPDLDIVVHVDY